MLEPVQIIEIPKTFLMGMRQTMSFKENKTKDLWKQFMPRRQEIQHTVGPEFYSVEVYPSLDFFQSFDPTATFDKWATKKVSSVGSIPEGMALLVLSKGLYAVFSYRGLAKDVGPYYQYVLNQWIPESQYRLDHRPHFAKMGEQYKANDPESEEELWFPIKEQ